MPSRLSLFLAFLVAFGSTPARAESAPKGEVLRSDVSRLCCAREFQLQAEGAPWRRSSEFS